MTDWCFRMKQGCWICPCPACPDAIRSKTPVWPSRPCAALACRKMSARPPCKRPRGPPYGAPARGAVRRLCAGRALLDGGHNPAAQQALADTRAACRHALHLIVGLQGQKDVEGYLAPLLDIASSLTAVPVPAARGGAADPEALAKRAQEMGCQAGTASDVHAALAHLANEASKRGVLVCGSLYLAGDVLKAERGHA